MASFKGTTKHDLTELIGKKIRSIRMQEIDVNGDGQIIKQFYLIVCADAEEFVLAIDGGNEDKQYATASLIEAEELEELLEIQENMRNADLPLDEEEDEEEEDLFSSSEDMLFDHDDDDECD